MTRLRALPLMLPMLLLVAACGGGGSHLATTATTTTTSSVPPSSTTTGTGATTTTAAATSTTATTATTGHGSTTTGPHGTTTRAPVTVPNAPTTTPTTTGPSPPVTSFTHNPAIPDCAPAAMTTSASTDAPSYPAGATVKITAQVTNKGSVRCQFQPPGGPGGLEVDNAAGTPVWGPQVFEGVYVRPPYYTLGPGQSFVSGTWTWDQHTCAPPCRGPEGGAVPAGQYKAVPTPEGTGAATDASFAIR